VSMESSIEPMLNQQCVVTSGNFMPPFVRAASPPNREVIDKRSLNAGCFVR